MSPRRVTLLTYELRGFLPVGGMGTATAFLALALARLGHTVEVLVAMHEGETIDPHWDETYRAAGVRVRGVPEDETAASSEWYYARPYDMQLALRPDPPDVVIAHDFGAPAHAALRLREAGLAFEDTLFVVFCHGGMRYTTDISGVVHVPDLPQVLTVGLLEQAAVELADAVVSPSRYLLEWMRGQRWRLPARTAVIPYFTRAGSTGETPWRVPCADGVALQRLMFFGRLDERKGLKPFAAGLNALEPELLRDVELEFLGRTTATWPRSRTEELLSPRVRSALRHVSFHTTLDQHDALASLARPGTVAVMPSLQENSPNAVYECLEHGIPFIASNVGGVPELIDAADRERVLFEPTAAGVAAALRRVLRDGRVIAPARPAYSGEESLRRWGEITAARPAPRPRPSDGNQRIDVIVVHDASEEALSRCLAALERQTYKERNMILESTREAGLRKATGEFIVFLTEEDVAAEDLLEMLARAQRATGADVVTCALVVEGARGPKLRFFLGDAAGTGVLANAYGTIGLVRRALVEAAVVASSGARDPDWGLFAALCAAGARIRSLPLPLVTRNAERGSLDRDPTDALLVVKTLEGALPRPLRSIPRLAAGLAAAAPSTHARPQGFIARALERLRRGVG